jgi:hypothetical protein
MNDLNQTLVSELGSTKAALAMNRRGKLTETQRRTCIGKERRILITMALIGAAGILFVTLVTAVLVDTKCLALLVLFIPLGIAGYRMNKGINDFDWRVLTVEGHAEPSARNTSRTRVEYFVTVEYIEFKTSWNPLANLRYRIYYEPETMTILSAEIIGDEQAEAS